MKGGKSRDDGRVRRDKIFRKIFSRNARIREYFMKKKKRRARISRAKLLLESGIKPGIERSINIDIVFNFDRAKKIGAKIDRRYLLETVLQKFMQNFNE